MNDEPSAPCTGWTARIASLLTRIRLHSTPRTMLALFVLLLAFVTASVTASVVLNVQLDGVTALESTFSGYSADQAYRALAAEGEVGRRNDLVFQAIDLLLIPIYALLYATTIGYAGQRLFGQQSGVVTWGTVIPLLAGLVDYAENAALITVLLVYPQPLMAVATVASVFTMAKWTLVFVGTILALLGLFGLAGQRTLSLTRRRRQRQSEIRRPTLPRPPLAA